VPRGQSDGSLRPYSRLSRPENKRIQRQNNGARTTIKSNYLVEIKIRRREPGQCSWQSDRLRIVDLGVGVRVSVRSRFFSSPRRPDLFWGPPSLLFNSNRGIFPSRLSGRDLKLILCLQLLPRSRIRESTHPLRPVTGIALLLHIHFPMRLHGVVLNLLGTGTISPFINQENNYSF
jgi:hypothetical protein